VIKTVTAVSQKELQASTNTESHEISSALAPWNYPDLGKREADEVGKTIVGR
jgi:hypothetical protein